jgi:hypothetical protein
MTDWLESQLLTLRSLVGTTISHWKCIEMALNEPDDESDLTWYHHSVPMLQLHVLYACINDTWHSLTIYQNDDEWGIYLTMTDGNPTDAQGMSSSFRFRSLPELPTGEIFDVSFNQNDRQNIASIDLCFRDTTLNLLAGEVYENHDGSFAIALLDESVLVQIDGHSPAVT